MAESCNENRFWVYRNASPFWGTVACLLFIYRLCVLLSGSNALTVYGNCPKVRLRCACGELRLKERGRSEFKLLPLKKVVWVSFNVGGGSTMYLE